MSALFGNPGAVAWLLAPVAAAALLWIFARVRARTTRAFVGPALLARMTAGIDPARRRAKAACVVLALVALGLAMMRPQWGAVYEKIERKGIDIVFLVDVSKSMLADDVKPSRLGRVVMEVKRFIETAPIDDRVALVCFAGLSHVQCPLTHDFGAFRLFLDDVDPRLIPRGGTALEDALYRAMQTFPDEERNHKAIVLFTDGEGHEGDVERASSEAARRNIRIFTVGIGSPDGALIPIADERGNRTYLKDQDGQVVKSRLDEVTLQKIALATNGAYKRMVGGEDTLGAIYGEASKIEAKTLESRQERRAVDRFQWFVVAGLSALAIEALLAESRRRRRAQDRVPEPVLPGKMGEDAADAGGRRIASRAARRVLLLACAATCAANLSAQSPAAIRKAEEGRDLMTAGRFDDALAKFKDAQIDLPDAPELALDIGLALYKLGRFDEAASAFAGAAAARSVKLEAIARFHLGNTLFRQGNLEGALVCLNESLRLAPDDEDARFNREIVVRHLKERERQKKDEEQKQEIEKLLRECLAREIAVTRATLETLVAAGEQPPPMESVAEIAAELDVSAASRPASRPSHDEIARVGSEVAVAQDAVEQLAGELLDKVAKEAESRPAGAPAAGPGGAPPPHGHDPAKLEKVAGLVTGARDAMKDVSAALRGPGLRAAVPHEERALRKLLDALNEFLDELTRIILEQGRTVTATSAAAHEAGVELVLPDSRPAPATRPAASGEPASRPGALRPVADLEKTRALAAKEQELRARTDAFATGVEGMLQGMKAAETRGADSPHAGEGPKQKAVEEALTLLHEASDHVDAAARDLLVPALQPAFDSEVLALKKLIEARKKLSPPEQQQGDDQQQKQDDRQKQDQKKDERQENGQDEKGDRKDERKQEKKLSPEEAQALLDRLKQQEKDWREKKNAEKKGARDPGVKKDW